MKTRESGERIKVRGTVNAPASHGAVKWLAQRLSESYGGCTVIPGCEGFWIAGDDETLEAEPATIVEVSFLPSNAGAVEYCRFLFTAAVEKAGGTWAHIEVSTFHAAHTHIKDYGF